MIQRIQTLFLLFAAIINIVVFFTPVYTRATQDPAGWIGILFTVLLIAAIILSIYSIFLYGDRLRQISWVRLTLWIQIALFAASLAIFLTLGGVGTYLIGEALGVGLVLLAAVFIWLAARNIRKDQELVESMDRIR